jgi:hypothetical protein
MENNKDSKKINKQHKLLNERMPVFVLVKNLKRKMEFVKNNLFVPINTGSIKKTGIWAIFSCFSSRNFFFKNDLCGELIAHIANT